MDLMNKNSVHTDGKTRTDKKRNGKSKRHSLIFLLFSLLLSLMLLLTGCGAEKDYALDETALATDLLENGSFACELYQVKEDRIADFITLDAPEKEILCMGNGTYADSFGIFTLADTDAAKSALETVNTYLADLADSYQDYLPQEAEKVTNAVVLQKGRYVVFCICEDPESVQKEIESAFTETEADAQGKGDGAEESDTDAQPGTNENADSSETAGYPAITTDAKIKKYGNIVTIGDAGYELYTYVDKPAEKYAAAVNRAAKALAGKTEVYDLLIPLSSGITLPDADYDKITSSSQKKALAAIEEKLEAQVKIVDPYEKLMQHRDEYIYFRTDHHWTADGAYYAYETFCESKGLIPISRTRRESEEFAGFLGSFYNDSKAKELEQNPDTVKAYLPISSTSMQCENADGKKASYSVIYDVSGHPASLKYNAFIAGDNAISTITNEDLADGSSCIVVKESFGNAFVPYLADHYQTVYVVDYRYWNGDLIKLAEEKQADDLIFVNNLSMIRSDYLTGRFNQLI